MHYYNYLTDCWDVTSFPRPRFTSEYGFQSFPSFETLAPVSDGALGDWNFNSSFTAHRQHSESLFTFYLPSRASLFFLTRRKLQCADAANIALFTAPEQHGESAEDVRRHALSHSGRLCGRRVRNNLASKGNASHVHQD